MPSGRPARNAPRRSGPLLDSRTDEAEIHGGRSDRGYHGARLHFGLGRRDRIDRVEVRWPGSAVESFEHVEVDRIVTLTEGANHPEPDDR
jgi:hypothetical protein